MKTGQIAIILVSPENPDNIGAAARAAKNMGFSDLRLVKPPWQWRTRAKKLAMSADDILEKAAEFSSLPKAMLDLGLVIGTTRRGGGHRGAFLPFNKALSKVRGNSIHQKVGIVFGRESKGLANEDSALCDHLVTIPTGQAYPSLNLAQAVIVMLFALSWDRPNFSFLSQKGSLDGPHRRRASMDRYWDRGAIAPIPHERVLNKKEVESSIAHFESALKALGYKRSGANLLPRILQTLRGLIKRSGLLEPEGQMIKGLSRRIREKVGSPR